MKQPSRDDYYGRKKEELIEELLWMRRINEAQAEALRKAGITISIPLLGSDTIKRGGKSNG